MAEEIGQHGIKVYYIESKNPLKIFLRLKEIQDIEQIDLVHSHIHFFSGFIVLIAAIIGIKNRIVHSHTSNDPRNLIYITAMKILIMLFSTGGIAVSKSAYKDLFFVDKGNIIMHCGVPFPNRHIERRTTDEIITLGTVARLEAVKNQKFLIDVAHYMQMSYTVKLIIVGDGSLRSELEEYVNSLNMKNSVTFTGWSANIYEYLALMNCFVMTSFREGLPLSAIEAQVAGVPVVLADTISEETIVLAKVSGIRVSLNSTLDIWQINIVHMSRISFDRNLIYETDFNLDRNVTALEKFYLDRLYR